MAEWHKHFLKQQQRRSVRNHITDGRQADFLEVRMEAQARMGNRAGPKQTAEPLSECKL